MVQAQIWVQEVPVQVLQEWAILGLDKVAAVVVGTQAAWDVMTVVQAAYLQGCAMVAR
jgi:hypothetical protein